MKAFEFGLGIFFLFPSPPSPCPEWGAGGRDRVQMLVGITLSPSPKPLWPEGRWNQWLLCVH